jgi:hypothetical protein
MEDQLLLFRKWRGNSKSKIQHLEFRIGKAMVTGSLFIRKFLQPQTPTLMNNHATTDHLISEIATRTGITHEQAQSAFMATLEFIKTKLPDSVGSQLTGLLNGKEFDYNEVMKDRANIFREQAQVKFEELKDEAQVKLEELRVKAKDMMDKMF